MDNQFTEDFRIPEKLVGLGKFKSHHVHKNVSILKEPYFSIHIYSYWPWWWTNQAHAARVSLQDQNRVGQRWHTRENLHIVGWLARLHRVSAKFLLKRHMILSLDRFYKRLWRKNRKNYLSKFKRLIFQSIVWIASFLLVFILVGNKMQKFK